LSLPFFDITVAFKIATLIVLTTTYIHNFTFAKKPMPDRRLNRHGSFLAEYVGDSYAVIHHVTPWGEMHKIFIPPEKRAFISRGKSNFWEVNYKSFQLYS